MRYWINADTDPECPEGYVGIVDETVGGVIIYVVRHLADDLLSLLLKGYEFYR